jgi:hypothetical protein
VAGQRADHDRRIVNLDERQVAMSPNRAWLSPIVIGGVGGGGTRVVSRILDALEVDLGPVSSPSLDNVLFTTLFTIPVIAAAPKTFAELDELFAGYGEWWEIFAKATTGDRLTGEEILQVERLVEQRLAPGIRRSVRLPDERKTDLLGRVYQALAHCRLRLHASSSRDGRWGWKEPNTSVVLPQIVRRFPDVKYVHVIRHGLDMAYSDNVNQVRNWGRLFDLETADDPDPDACLAFWVRTNQRTIAFASDVLGRNFALVKFDELVLEPKPVISSLCGFLDRPVDAATLDRLCAIPSVPRSLGRYRERAYSTLNPSLVEKVREFGFDVQGRA